MGRKIQTEEDLSFTESEKIRGIVDHQMRQNHNHDYITGIAKDAQINIFHKIFTSWSSTIVLIALTAFITNRIDYYFTNFHGDNIDKPNDAVVDGLPKQNLTEKK